LNPLVRHRVALRCFALLFVALLCFALLHAAQTGSLGGESTRIEEGAEQAFLVPGIR
jgi:hypothetical protein